MKNKLLLLLIITFTFNIIPAQQKQTEEKIILTSDEQIFDIKKNILHLKNNVRITYKEYIISGAEAIYDKEENKMKIKGKVSLIQDKTKLYSNNLTISLADEKIFAEGKVSFIDEKDGKKLHLVSDELSVSEKEKDKKIVAKNNVQISYEDISGFCNIAEIYPDKEEAILSGSAKAKINKSQISANTLILFLKDKKIKAEGETQVIVYPEKGEK